MKTSRPTAQPQGLPVPIETTLLASEARMAKRSQHRESEGQDGRSELRRDGTGSPGTSRVI